MERGEVRKDAGGAGGGELGGLMGAGGHGPTREAGVEGGLDIEGRIAGHERGRGFSVERGEGVRGEGGVGLEPMGVLGRGRWGWKGQRGQTLHFALTGE